MPGSALGPHSNERCNLTDRITPHQDDAELFRAAEIAEGSLFQQAVHSAGARRAPATQRDVETMRSLRFPFGER